MTESQNCEDKGINTRALAFVMKIVLSNKAKHKHHLQVCPRSSYPGLRGPAEAGVLPCLFLCGKAETSMDNVSYEVTEVGGEWTRRVSE